MWVQLYEGLAIQVIDSNTFQIHFPVYVMSGVNVGGEIFVVPTSSSMLLGKLTIGKKNKWVPFSKSSANFVDSSKNRLTLFHD